ncbi:MAG: GMC family oxidoreductase [Myxococcales bacterium]|nr:MAG: GMC family oxidoreductase [Myxococcales bacterium]
MSETSPILKVMQPAEIPDAGLDLRTEVVIVGSGASGAVMAYELSRAGAKVVVLEAGPYIPSSEFQEHTQTAFETLYQDHGNQVNTTGDMVVLQGKCIGGSTVVNTAACFRPPDQVLESWRTEHGLENLSPEVLAPYFDKLESNLSIHQNEPHEVNYNGRLLLEGAKKIGIPASPTSRNVKNCALSGHCLAACRTDRKQSMLVTYLPWASELGATILSGTRADTFEVRDRRITAVNAIATDSTGRNKPVRVEADLVVVAAGPIQTPLLFQKNKLANSSGQVGLNFACHPSLAVFGEHHGPVYAWVGATITAHAGEIENPLRGGYLIEAAMADPVNTSAATDGGVGRDYLDFVANSKNFQSAITLIHDHNVGRVFLEDGRKRIEYDIDDRDFESMREALRGVARIYFAAGAKRVYLPTTRRTTIERESDVDSVINSLTNGKHKYRLASYHPQGTMRMGADPKRSVVGPDGRCHDLDNVYVPDASLFPSSIMVNPQVTVYGLASYIADQIKARG